MQKLILAATAAALSLTMTAPGQAAVFAKAGIAPEEPTSEMDRRKPRIPGGSGCDDPRDLIEHPECRR